MKFSKEEIAAVVESTGFDRTMVEKVFHLLVLLRSFNNHPFLRNRLVLKGGTALNLFIFDMPRLSVDLDFNYIGSVDKQIMLDEGPEIEEAVISLSLREGLQLRQPVKKYHAGWRISLRYESVFGPSGNLKIDVNFMHRVPLWPIVRMNSRKIGAYQLKRIPVLSLHELAAGKLNALFSRHASRDLFDTHHLLSRGKLDRKMLRLAFVLHGAMNPRDWLAISSKDIRFNAKELKNDLLPVLPDTKEKDYKKLAWADRMTEECRKALRVILPLTKNEKEFLHRVQEYGEIHPNLLTQDEKMQAIIETHPLLQWRILNVKKFKSKRVS